jgi:hypothetical protein
MTRKTNRRSRAILLVLVVVALATAGLVYAHWTETLKVDALAASGAMTLRVTAANTDDDGSQNGWDNVCTADTGGGTNYDRWGATSSNDPSSYCGSAGYATPRYDKDVARCRVTGTVGLTSTVSVENAYPGYHCTIRQTAQNVGTIPMKNQATRVYACGPGADCSSFPTNFVALTYVRATDTFSYDSGDGDPDFELIMQQNPEGVCGSQFDPGASFGSRVTFHVLQDAAQAPATRCASSWKR